jgi:hypothetical protein
MEHLDSIGKRYGVRPSVLVGERDEFLAFSIDLWAHNWGVQAERRLMGQLERKRGRGRH